MLNNLKFFATLVACVLVSFCANAQEVRVDNKLFSAPTEYVQLENYKLYKASYEQIKEEWFEKSSQSDSIFVLNKVVEGKEANKYFVTKYYWRNGEKKQKEYKKPFVWNRPKAVASGDTIVFGRRVYYEKSTEEMTLAEQERVLSGKNVAFDPEHKNLLSQDRHKWGLAALGGANFVESKFNPQVSLRWFYETCHLSYELEGTYSRASHTEESKAYGSSYNTFIGSANLVWKAIHLNPFKTSYIGFGVNAGYGLHKTDKDKNSEFYVQNYGFTGGGFFRISGNLGKNLRLLAEAGYKFYPKVLHSGNGQEFSCNGPYANVGIAWLFNNQ